RRRCRGSPPRSGGSPVARPDDRRQSEFESTQSLPQRGLARPHGPSIVVDSTMPLPIDSPPDQPWRWFGALFDSALDAILITDSRARYVDANPAARTLLGYSREELLVRGVQDVTPLDAAIPFAEQWERFLKSGSLSGEYEVHRKDGTTRLAEF